jgi:hypothetical protein
MAHTVTPAANLQLVTRNPQLATRNL